MLKVSKDYDKITQLLKWREEQPKEWLKIYDILRNIEIIHSSQALSGSVLTFEDTFNVLLKDITTLIYRELVEP